MVKSRSYGRLLANYILLTLIVDLATIICRSTVWYGAFLVRESIVVAIALSITSQSIDPIIQPCVQSHNCDDRHFEFNHGFLNSTQLPYVLLAPWLT